MKRALALILALCCITGLAVGKSDKAHGQRFVVVGASSSCANQLVLDYSNSCALIGQAWGQ